MNSGVQIELDKASLNHLNKQFNVLGTTMEKAGKKAIFTVLMKIKTEAQNRLRGRGHIVTSRLRNSIYVQMRKTPSHPQNTKSYNADGKTFDSTLKTVSFQTDLEGAIGTNVEYAGAIEFGARPHTITAKNAKSLGTTKTGFFGKKVNHPGYGGDSYLYWALKNVDVSKSVGEDMKNDIKFSK